MTMIATVLGAGYMGSAITFPLIDAGLEVRLWGTWLDDDIIEQCRHGDHPKLKKRLPVKVRLFDSGELEMAVADADIVFSAVTSEGFVAVLERYLAIGNGNTPAQRSNMYETPVLCALTKGFVRFDGRVCRISEAAEEIYREKCGILKGIQWVSVGGPVKAVELSHKVQTATVYASAFRGARDIVPLFATEYYKICTSEDVCGVELSSALKNVYSIAVGICDGMYRACCPGLYHNFKALVFNQALREMALVVEKRGGDRETVFDLAGVGDLYVTSASGRNGRFGELVGKGVPPGEAYQSMKSRGEFAEGYNTLKMGYEFARDLGIEAVRSLPLFEALYDIVFRGTGCADTMERIVRS
jgi:glycerol-3-phosphate dehydrogenase (NAD(P)+)